mgnify:CR=1 FL=1
MQTISPSELKAVMNNSDIQIIDVREPYEFEDNNIGGINIPLDEVLSSVDKIDTSKKVVFCCQSGKRSSAIISLKGMGMGAADIVPGVSGGTIALIAGIYEEFVNTLKSFNLGAIKALKEDGLKGFWTHINGSFLVALVLGIGISLISMVKLIKYLLEVHPVLIWSFFFGLIVASAIFVAKTITKCAMVLPGISGSFILVLLGKYAYIIESLSQFKLDVIALFGVGCVTGLLSFSHLLSWLLKSYHNLTMAILTGFMIGSLNKIWPWKKTLSYMTDRHGEQKPLEQINLLPAPTIRIKRYHPL